MERFLSSTIFMLKVVPIVLPVILFISAGRGFWVQPAVTNMESNNTAKKIIEPRAKNLKKLNDRKQLLLLIIPLPFIIVI